MAEISITEASVDDYRQVSALVVELLVELDPQAAEEVAAEGLDRVAQQLLSNGNIWAFLAREDQHLVGVITLHQCAAIYAEGLFGEISELYVKPAYRSSNIGGLLLGAAFKKGRALGWKRLEVGSPSASDSPRTMKFYQDNGFVETGARLRCIME